MIRVELVQKWIDGYKERQKTFKDLMLEHGPSIDQIQNAITFVGQWDSTRAYKRGDMVLKNGNAYLCDGTKFVEVVVQGSIATDPIIVVDPICPTNASP